MTRLAQVVHVTGSLIGSSRLTALAAHEVLLKLRPDDVRREPVSPGTQFTDRPTPVKLPDAPDFAALFTDLSSLAFHLLCFQFVC